MKKSFHAVALLAAGTAGFLGWYSAGRAQAPDADKTKAKAGPKQPGTEQGFALFQTRCMGCHGNPAMADRAPDPSVIRQMSPQKIYDALTTGPMKVQGQALSDQEKRLLAEFMGGSTPIGLGDAGEAKNMPNRCASNPALPDPSSGASWNGWGVDLANTRFQAAKAAGLTAAQVPRLKLKWAFGYPSGVSAHGQPSVVGGRVFVGADIGYVYSLDAKTGCVYWSYQTNSLVRNSITVAPVKGHGSTKYAAFFGDARANVYALDAQNGELLWKKHVDDFFVARITAAVKVYEGRVYVPVSSSEEFTGGNLDYPCCTSRGSVVALDASTGNQIWKTYVVAEPKPTRKNSKGVQLYAPAGGSVWNSPTVDPLRHAVYFGTGDGETEPADPHTDAIMAVDMDTGKELWTYQATPGDAFMGGCGGGPNAPRSENCPSVQGPDSDIGNSPILRTLPGGKRVLIAGTKEGDVFALDPDNNGKLLWRVHASNTPAPPPGSRPGFGSGIVWGGAADEQNVYYGFTGGGMAALELATGKKKWFVPITTPTGPGRIGHGAAATVIPGVIFVGGSDGLLSALATFDGHTLWQYDTAKNFDTVNKIPAHGGSMNSAGPIVVNGMVFLGSGYAVGGGTKPGNVLLAFGL